VAALVTCERNATLPLCATSNRCEPSAPRCPALRIRNERPPCIERAQRQCKCVRADDLSETKIGVKDQHRAVPVMRDVRPQIDAAVVELAPIRVKPRQPMRAHP
jgi:hypothetical protein